LREIRHFYHLYLDGDAGWTGIAAEYAEVLRISGFPVMPRVGLVGTDRTTAKLELTKYPGWQVAAEADSGWEQVTLKVLQDDLPEMDDSTAVLYTHAKGSWRNIALEDQWRRSMLWHLVYRWHHCLDLLRTHDIAGCHWQGRYFAGNFWWAKAGYLKTLPPVLPAVREEDRLAAESWLGEGQPARTSNLVKGWPPAGTEEGAMKMSDLLPARYIRRHAVWPSRSAREAGT
jgi:hypothetical protein